MADMTYIVVDDVLLGLWPQELPAQVWGPEIEANPSPIDGDISWDSTLSDRWVVLVVEPSVGRHIASGRAEAISAGRRGLSVGMAKGTYREKLVVR